ncbi:BadM/Rrf2 family transcriptional regulator [Pelomonas sp. Root1217]|uniref:Rrf2 family transcriptional regulator n=1 Tax=Pelomonas sp. Root1217 TaxID=1736430 RepID=UPI00070BA7D4|nr:Rrf2 family transcriptional regulator [Pelomonas sp. Root1217]KQV60547.1 BadM/Rrf2 family transcriptional regulator [Pelomonas sp. Root1217]
MRLTAFTDYSLRVLMFLAAEPDRRATVGEICAAFDVKANHLTKVVHHLAKRGWVSTVRGKGGGLTLAKPAEQIRIGEVVRDTEGQALPAECFSAEASHCAIVSHCRLKGVLGEAVQAFHAVLDRYTLADITANRQQLVQLLHFMAPARSAA